MRADERVRQLAINAVYDVPDVLTRGLRRTKKAVEGGRRAQSAEKGQNGSDRAAVEGNVWGLLRASVGVPTAVRGAVHYSDKDVAVWSIQSPSL